MRYLGVIPARYDSQRLPGKPLADIAGKPMVIRVYEQAIRARSPHKIIVATDDERIRTVCESAGIECVLTGKSHPSGTDRIAEVMRTLYADFDVYINIQGDMPFIPPNHIDTLCGAFRNPDVSIATLITPCLDENVLRSSASIKVVRRNDGFALYFSRSVVPFGKNPTSPRFRHIGVYAYTRNALSTIASLAPSMLEISESLEQLRWLENGMSIYTLVVPEDTPSVDTPEDLEYARAYAAKLTAPAFPTTP
ncbi:MAG: 3-deoxy-manno-octulosonate cytidylyltransferase [Bacteroidia bacterium]|nr:3-deoxy-manno-octulosonate cytidylyltransferase [Bacteroidia bacterium]MDW8334116.1 3-deoxy-manno-octulosonate cytidylyltransferase [Bacteroidia bacterium]